MILMSYFKTTDDGQSSLRPFFRYSNLYLYARVKFLKIFRAHVPNSRWSVDC